MPLDASDALDGSSNQTPDSNEPGDTVVTVIFPGDLDPEDWARGFVDTGVVNSDCCNTSSDDPLNVNQSADIEPNTATENPDLVRASREGRSFLYEFDEPLTDDDVIQNTSGLRLYFSQTSQNSTIPDAGAQRVEDVNDTTLRAAAAAQPTTRQRAEGGRPSGNSSGSPAPCS